MFGIATYLALVLVTLVGAIRRPAVAFAGVLCMYGLKQWGQNTSALLVQHRTASNIFVGALVLAAIAILAFRRDELDFRMPRNWKLIVALYAYAFMTLLFTPDLDAALDAWALQWLYLLTFAIAAPFVLNKMDDVKIALSATVHIGGAICALALFLGNWGPRGLIVLGDIYEHETNPLAIASLGGTVFLGALFLLRMPQTWWRKIPLLAFVPIGIAVIFRSQSRGQLGAAAIAAAIGWILVSRKALGTRVFSLGLAAVLLGLIGWWVWDLLQVDPRRWAGDLAESDAQGRLEMAKALLGQAMSSPGSMIFGLGNSSSYHYVGFYPHITVLEVIAEEGLVGFALYAAIIVTTLTSAATLFGAMNQPGASGHRVAAAAVLALFVFELALSMKQGTLLSSIYVFAYAATIARMSRWQADGQAATAPDQPVPKPVVRFANLMR
jgi:hypothetical protein